MTVKFSWAMLSIGLFLCHVTNNSFSQANQTLSNLTSPTAVNESLLPASSNTVDLGSLPMTFRSIYAGTGYFISATRVINIDGTGNNLIGSTYNTSNTGSYNTFMGHQSGTSNLNASYNTAIGYGAFYSNLYGAENVMIGAEAGYYTTSGFNNVAIGRQAFYRANASSSIAVGSFALSYSTGAGNIGIGHQALYSSTTGSGNTVTGSQAMYSNTTGSYNTAYGGNTMGVNQTGGYNVAIGHRALSANKGSYNSGVGANVLTVNSTGIYNTALGYGALDATYTSNGNVGLGYRAGAYYNNGHYNTFIGADTRGNGNDIYNSTALGRAAIVTAPNQVRIGNSSVISIGGYTSWTNISDGRVKKNIEQNVPGLALINKLTPVTYNLDLDAQEKITGRSISDDTSKEKQATRDKDNDLKKQKESIRYTGFIAQDVEKAAVEISYDFSAVDAAKNDKDLYGLRYAEFVVPLVKAVQELSAENETLKKRLDNLERLISGKTMSTSAHLDQNVPNPANGSTYITYYIPAGSAKAQLVITDATGRRLKTYTLISSGTGQQIVNRNELSAGMFQYTLFIDGKLIDTKRMTFLN